MFDFLTQKFSDAFSYLTGQRTLTEKNVAQVIQKLKQALLEADISVSYGERFYRRSAS